MEYTILLVEDDSFIRDSIVKLLQQENYKALACSSLAEARTELIKEIPDLIILDVLLPDGSGFELCREIKDSFNVPILFLTCCDEDEDMVRGLDCGADDYIAKPFRSKVLFARIRALLRRTTTEQNNIFRVDVFLFDNSKRICAVNGIPASLTPIEYMLLYEIAKARGAIVTRETLLRSIWQMGCDYLDANTLSVHISRLRSKLGKYSDRLVTVRGTGYSLRCENE